MVEQIVLETPTKVELLYNFTGEGDIKIRGNNFSLVESRAYKLGYPNIYYPECLCDECGENDLYCKEEGYPEGGFEVEDRGGKNHLLYYVYGVDFYHIFYSETTKTYLVINYTIDLEDFEEWEKINIKELTAEYNTRELIYRHVDFILGYRIGSYTETFFDKLSKEENKLFLATKDVSASTPTNTVIYNDFTSNREEILEIYELLKNLDEGLEKQPFHYYHSEVKDGKTIEIKSEYNYIE